MSTFKGNDGVIKLGGSGGTNIIGEVRSYSLEHTADTIEDTAMGDANRTYKDSLKSFSERQLDGFVGCCLTMIPAIDLILLSLSKLFVPILPICGKVKVII